MRRPAAIALVVAAAVLAAAPFLLTNYGLSLLTQGLILALAAAALDVLVGCSGLPSLSQAAFFGIGGYSVALVQLKLHWPAPLAIAVGLSAGIVIAAMFGSFAVRAKGIYFLVITLAFTQVAWGVAVRWDAVGGYNGLTDIARPSLPGFDLEQPVPFYYAVVTVVAAATLLLYAFTVSPLGLVVQGVRSSERRMRVMGYLPHPYRLTAFVVAATGAAAAGILNTYYQHFVGPDSLNWVLSAQLMLMVILGGAGLLWAPALAGVAISIAQNVASTFTARWASILGILFVAVVMFAPRGLFRLTAGFSFKRPRRVGVPAEASD
jgi:branched-chain amino acid transport system permease protein